jgi:tetratricopeptide (TPR) repeat protein
MMALNYFALPILFSALITSTAHAKFDVSDAELASLPAFCAARYKGSPAEYKAWAQKLGSDFAHTHHYCNALNYINRYYRSRNERERKYILERAEGNLDYMIGHASPNYSLMPEIYLNRGLVYSLMGQHAKAITDMLKAIEMNPMQSRAFTMLSDYYARTKQHGKALEIVTQGLKYNPGNTALQRRYNEFGGKLPYPEPFITPQPESIVEDKKKTSEPVLPSGPEPINTDPPTTLTTPANQSSVPLNPGTGKNPFCRFCPD